MEVDKITSTVVDFDPFAGSIIEKIVPATEPQKEIFASCMLGGEEANLAYNESFTLYLTGNLNVNVLRESVAELHQRHESLRATFTEDGSKMIIYESKPPNVLYQDLDTADTASQQHILEKYHADDARMAFDLFNGPLTRVTLFRLNAEAYVLIITAHHIICDGWSFGVLLEDVSKLYNAKCLGLPYQRKPLLFSDYSIHSLQYERSAGYQDTLNYWKKEYEGPAPAFEIPPDFPRPGLRTYKSRRDDFILTSDIADTVKKTGAKYGSGFVNTLMSAFEVLLYKYTGNRDVIIGLPTAGQAATEMYDLIGHCVNFLPLRSSPDPDIPFAEYLKKRKTKTLEDYEHQQFTFGTFLKEMKVERDPSRIPLAPISFNIDIGMSKEVAFHDLAYRLVYNKRVAETFEIFLNISDCDNGYEFQWSYNTQLFEPATISGLMDKYTYLLKQIIENPEQKIADLWLEDKKALIDYWENWNNRVQPDLWKGTILDKIDQSCQAHADKTALCFNSESVSYRELYERSNQMAHYLLSAGVTTGSVVGIAMERSIDLVISILGVLKAGGVFVPLDPQYAQERIEYMLENSGASFLLTSTRYAGKLKTDAREICVQSIQAELVTCSSVSPKVSLTSDSLVYILYTSGSTGKPKGVMIANQSLVNYISWAVGYYLKGAPGVVPLYTSISFDLTITSIFSPLVSGSLLKIYEEEEPVTMLEKIFTDAQVSMIKLTPSHLRLVRDSIHIRKNLPGQHLILIVGGEELETALAKDIYGLCNGNVVICNEYGPTEATVGCMIYDYNSSDIQPSVPIGVPVSNARIYLLDEALHPVPKGIKGEIYIGGVCLAKGYYGNELLTQERFLNDPFVPGGRMYKTGDNAVMQQNDLLLFKGRIDDQVKLRGYRIELGEIDYHLSGIENIKSAVTIVKEDVATAGNGYLVSYIVLREKLDVTEQTKAEWRNTLHSKLPDYMVPGLFIVLEELPLTANGKVDKKRLPEPKVQSGEYIVPQTREELLLAEIWQEAFKLDRISVYDNFFELGGHSLLAVRVIRTLEDRTGKNLGVTSIFRFPVLKDLAGEYGRAHSQTTAEERDGDREWYVNSCDAASPESFTSTESQQEIWQECIIGGEEANISYNLSHTEYQDGDLDIAALKRSLQYLMNRHELLHAVFGTDGTTVLLHPEAPLPFHFEDISSKKPEQQQLFIKDLIQSQQDMPFDLAKDLLFRLNVLKLGDRQYLFNLVIHHLICDGSSFDTVLKELSLIYNACKSGQEPLLDKAIKFSAYAEREQKHYQSEAYKKDLNYWISKFEKDVPVLDLPLDYPYPAGKTYKSNISYFSINKEESADIERLASRFNSTSTILLRTVFDILIYRSTKQEDFVVGLPVSDHVNVAGFSVVGHAINMLPVRSKVDGSLSFKDFLRRRNEAMINDYDHQRVTFGSIVKNIKVHRNAAKNTLVSVSFGSQMEKSSALLTLEGIHHKPVVQLEGYESLELAIDTFKENEELKFQVIYKSALFKPSTIAGLMEKYTYLLKQVSADPELLISDLRLADEEVILDKLKDWNHTFKQLPETGVIDLFETAAHQHPGNMALKFNSEALSYSQLDEEVNRMANFLLSQGVKKGDIVGVILERSPHVIISLLGVLKCGASYLPVDPEFPEDRIKFMLEDSEAAFVVINKAFSDKLGTSSSRHIVIEEVSAAIHKTDASAPGVKIAGSDLAYLLYTSGSTGKPKGVMVSHTNLLNFLLGMKDIFQTGVHTKLLSVTTVSFDIAGLEIFLPLISGGELVLADKYAVKDSKTLVSLLSAEQINMMQATPATYKLMIQGEWPKSQSLTLLCGGEALPKKIADSLLPKCGRLFNMYGPTETTIWSTVKEIKAEDELITIGRPIQNTTVYILDEDYNVLPPEAEGEIFIGGEGVALGYYKRPELTAERFIPDRFSGREGARLYRTGDIGKYLSNGELMCLGRSDNQAKIRGYRIELEEIEHYITKISGIKDAVVKVEGADDSDQKLIAYIVPSDTTGLNGAEVSKNEIISWRRELGRSLPDYMVPNGWVKLKEFPLTPNKKVDRNALTYREERAGEIANEEVTAGFTAIVEQIKSIWEEEIGIKGIEPDDDFFELGGHSMIAIRVMEKIEKQTGIKMPIATLFETPTIRALAKKVVDGEQPAYEGKVVIPIKAEGSKRPVFLVHAGGLNILLYKSIADFLDEDQPLYGLQGLGMDGDVTHIESIETIASRYLQEVVQHDTTGPYILMGYSFGGIIAFEMAKQLLNAGKEVSLVGILDTYVTSHWYKQSAIQKITGKILRQFNKITFFVKNLLKYPKDTISYQVLVANRKFNRNYKDPEEEQIHGYPAAVEQAYDNAYYKYRISPLDVKVELFRVEKRIYFLDDTKYLGWKQYALKGINVHTVPGDHKTFMIPPNNKILAEKIQAVVNVLN